MKNSKIGKTLAFLGLLLLFSGFLFVDSKSAYAATKVQVAAVEYYNEDIVVYNNNNTKFFIATEAEAAKDIWDVIPIDTNSDFTVIDISWLSPTIGNIIFIKGDDDKLPTRIILKQKTSKLDISINYSNIDNLKDEDSIGHILNIMTSEGTGEAPITFNDLEWKKGDTGRWESPSKLNVGLLKKYLVRGTVLYFRIRANDDHIVIKNGTDDFSINQDRAVKGYRGGIKDYYNDPVLNKNLTYEDGDNDYFPDGTKGRRFSSEVRVKLSKKTPSMVTGIDGEEFTAAIKYGKEYRVTVTYEDSSTATSEWIQVTDRAVRTIPLKTIVNNNVPAKYDINNKLIIFDGETVAFPQMFIEVRDYATAKAASSKITEINLDPQRVITSDKLKDGVPTAQSIALGDDNIYVDYNGNKNMILTIPSASATLPYEYSIVKKGNTFDLERAAWFSVTKSTGVKILENKAPEGSVLYVRQKEIKSKTATKTTAAIGYSLASTYVTHNVSYPSIPLITKDNITYVKGYPTPVVINIQLNTSGKEPFETAVKNVKLGTKEIGFDSVYSISDTDPSIRILTITLRDDDIKGLANCSNRALTISFMNGTVNKTSIKITIKNPTPAGALFIQASQGDAAGSTKVKMDSVKGTGNSFVYVITNDPVTNVNSETVLPNDATVQAFTSEVDIPIPTENQYLTIYEITASRNVVKFKCIQITSQYRK